MEISDKIGIGGFATAWALSTAVGIATYARVRNRDRMSEPVQARYEGYQWAMVVGGCVLLLSAAFLHSLSV